jgi:hypothetical protein
MSVATQNPRSTLQPGSLQPGSLHKVYGHVQTSPFLTRPPPRPNTTVVTDDITQQGAHAYTVGAGQASSGAPLHQQYGPASTQPFSGGAPPPNATVPTGDLTQTAPHVASTGGVPSAGPAKASTQPFSGGAPPPILLYLEASHKQLRKLLALAKFPLLGRPKLSLGRQDNSSEAP